MDKTIINYSVRDVTKARINEIAKMTFRSQGDVIDWLVEEKWERLGENSKQSEASIKQDS